MDDDDDKDDTKRKSRNLSEKKRRDQFNLLVNELSSMVSTNSRKMDKSTVLKSTIAFLKNHNEVSVRSRVHEIQENWKPSFLPNEEFTHLILEALDGFIIVFSSSGKIHYTSEGITSLLGHLPNDLLHMTIYDMVYEEEQQNIYNILLNPPKTVIDPLQSGISPENQVSFLCHVKRGSMENPPKVSYEYVQFTGYFRDNVDVENMMPSSRSYSGYTGETDARTLFVGTGRLMTPQLIREMSVVDTKSEFTSRHSLEWKFLFLDHRAPPIIGYLPFEVLGTSGYDYYHFDDLDRVVTCHEALMAKGEGTSCFYRFLTKGQQWIWLQTRFYITYHQWNSKPEFVVCTHRVVSYADVMKHMRRSNGSALKDLDDVNEDRKPQASTSNLMVMSPWSSKSSRASKSFGHTRDSSNMKLKRAASYRPDSDSNSMSADSALSHHSMLTQHSSVSQRSKKSKQNAPMPKPSTSLQPTQHSHFSQFNLPHSQAAVSTQQLHHVPNPLVHPITFQPPAQMLPHHQRPPVTAQVISAPFADQSQFLAAIPVQPVFSAAPSVIQPPPDYAHSNVVLTPAPNQIQDHLQRKHEELQKLIVQQQDELRRVSEQLFMARYGIIPSIVNVSLPFVANTELGESSCGNPPSAHITHPTYIEQHLQMMPHPQGIPQLHQNQHQHQMHVPMQYELSQKPNPSDHSVDSDQQNEDIMQYMQHQSQPPNQMPQPIHHHQQMDDFELMPFQMLNTQAQILFSSGNDNDGANSGASNK